MKKFIDTVEKYLIRLAALSMIILVLVQGLMTSDSMRFYLSWGERMEGQRLDLPVNSSVRDAEENAGDSSKKGFIIISTGKYASLPLAAVIVNGKVQVQLEQQKTKIEVTAGDKLQIDSRNYRFPINYEISAASANIAFPGRGQIVSAQQSVVTIGKVIVK